MMTNTSLSICNHWAAMAGATAKGFGVLLTAVPSCPWCEIERLNKKCSALAYLLYGTPDEPLDDGSQWTCFVCSKPIRMGDEWITNTKPEGRKLQHVKCPTAEPVVCDTKCFDWPRCECGRRCP